LGVQNLAISANTTFSQQTFAESLKLTYPLLSDYPERKVIRGFGVLNEKTMTALRSFFLIDPQGVIRKKALRGSEWVKRGGGGCGNPLWPRAEAVGKGRKKRA